MINPVLRREAKTSLRNWKIFYAIAAYSLIITAIAAVAIWQIMYNSYNPSFDPSEMLNVYIVLTIAQLVLILLVTPSFTAGSISGERERQTLDLLLVTKMKPISIVFGKFLSGLSIVVLMIFATLPVFALIMYFGGTSIAYIVAVTVYMLLVCAAFGAIAIFFSTIFKKTVVSMVFTYIIMGVLVGGTLIVYMIACSMYGSYFNLPLPASVRIVLLSINPAVGVLSIVCSQTGSSYMSTLLNLSNYWGTTNTTITTPVPMWIINAAAMIIITVVFILIAAARVKRTARKG